MHVFTIHVSLLQNCVSNEQLLGIISVQGAVLDVPISWPRFDVPGARERSSARELGEVSGRIHLDVAPSVLTVNHNTVNLPSQARLFLV